MTGPVVAGVPRLTTPEQARALAEKVIGPDRRAERHAEVVELLQQILVELRETRRAAHQAD